MRTYTEKELKNIVKNHAGWLNDDKNGIYADLSNTDLSNADLSNTDLRFANFENSDLSNVNFKNSSLAFAKF